MKNNVQVKNVKEGSDLTVKTTELIKMYWKIILEILLQGRKFGFMIILVLSLSFLFPCPLNTSYVAYGDALDDAIDEIDDMPDYLADKLNWGIEAGVKVTGFMAMMYLVKYIFK